MWAYCCSHSDDGPSWQSTTDPPNGGPEPHFENHWGVDLELTEVVGHEVGGEALGPVAHAGVVVRVAPKHQHSPAGDDGRVHVPERSAVLQDAPVNRHRKSCSSNQFVISTTFHFGYGWLY